MHWHTRVWLTATAGPVAQQPHAPPRETLPKAKAAATKALELDETLAEAHNALGYAEFLSDWNWARAERVLRQANELKQRYLPCALFRNPGDARTFGRKCGAGRAKCRNSTRFLRKYLLRLGYAYLSTRRYDEAIAQFQSALELNPDAGIVRAQLA